jgi:hypothetical protein
MIYRALTLLLTATFAVFCWLPIHARTCPSNVVAAPKRSMLYLYYPAVVDTQFHQFHVDIVPSWPLEAFDPSQLDPSMGPQAALMSRVQTMVQTGLCEFDIGVTSVTAMPTPPTPSRWQIVGIGSDTVTTHPPLADPLGGASCANDYNDACPQDYSRLWIGELQQWAGSNLVAPEEWATAISNLIVHEASHNYGTGHADSIPQLNSVEDASGNHFIADPGHGATATRFATALNHHSDESYEKMAHSMGLAAQTVTNWDFVNPNSVTADRFVIKIVALAPSGQSTLSEGWVYSGAMSPWSDAYLNLVGGVYFQGVQHDEYELEFHSIQQWNNGPAGQIPAGAPFHAGATIDGGPYVVTGAQLWSVGMQLPLNPRMVDFNGTTGFRLMPGNVPGFSVTLSNPQPQRGPLLITDVDIQFSPRMIDIETMMAGAVPRGLDDRPAALYTRAPTKARPEIPTRAALRRQRFVLGRKPVVIPVAALTDPRHVMVTQAGCGRETRSDARPPLAPASPPWLDNDGQCSSATALSLFPATFVYVTATIVDPRARHWDARRRLMVRGPVASRVFFQVAGTVPDANGNGIDDLLDICDRRSKDSNRDGVPDEAVQSSARVRAGRRR